MAEIHGKLLKGRKFLHISAAYGTKGQRGGFVFPQDEQQRIGTPPPPPAT